jgi:cobalt-zinc-cadmium efflux system protein
MSHDHSHQHTVPEYGKRFALGIALNIGFVLIEAFYGWHAGSLALLADAAHNLGDVGGLMLAWAGLAAGRLHANDNHTYGWQRASILASFANAVILLVIMGALGLEAIQRLQLPAAVDEWPVIIVASVGILINGATAWLFLAGSKGDLNIRGAFLHMMADALVSFGVVVSGMLVLWQGWTWVDPTVTLLIVGVVVWGTWSLFHQSLHLLFDGVPRDVDLPAVRDRLLALPGVASLHDLHVWSISTSRVGLTAHLVRGDGAPDDDVLLAQAEAMLHDSFEISHVTLQIESAGFAEHCALGEANAAVACPGVAPILHAHAWVDTRPS